MSSEYDDARIFVEGTAALVEQAQDEDRALTDEESDAIRAAANTLTSPENPSDRRPAVRPMRSHLERPGSMERRGNHAVTDPNHPFARSEIFAPPSAGRLRAFASTTAGRRGAFSTGQFFKAVIGRDVKAADWCLEHGMDIRNALSGGDNSKGGALVPEETTQAIIDLREQYGVFRANTRVIPMGSDTLLVPRRTGGLTAAFVGENQEGSDSDKSWDNVQLTAKKLMALTLYSTELAEDAVIMIGDDLSSEMAYAFAEKEDDCGWNGDGTSTYGGINGLVTKFNAGTTLAGYVLATSGHDTFAEIDLTDLTSVMAKLPEYALRGAKWYCSSFAFATTFLRLAAAAGGNTVSTLSGGMSREFLGFPVVISQKLPNSTGDLSGGVMLLFGDLRLSSTLGSRREIRVMISEDRYFEYDQVGIKATERFDIVNHDIGSTSVAGPLVCPVGN